MISHKPCWPSANSPSGYATDGGFPLQIQALSGLFDATTLVVPCTRQAHQAGEIALTGHQLSVVPLTLPSGSDWRRKLSLLGWIFQNGPKLWRAVATADAVHAPIPGDVGTLGLLLALALRKPLYVRHCGNWLLPNTLAKHGWKWLMEQFAGGRNVMLATGGGVESPSRRNPAIRWIFSTSLSEAELRECRKPRSAPSAQPRLILVGRQEKGKGTDVVLRSLPRLLDRFESLSFDVVGNGSALDTFKRLAVELGVQAHVRFHGQVEHAEVIRLLQQADLFCFPTYSEGFPKAVLEALACGLPVVTTRVSVLPQLIGQGGGVVLDESTPEALAQAVRHCLSDATRYQAMSAQAVALVEQYSLERWCQVIGELLRAAWGPQLLRSDA